MGFAEYHNFAVIVLRPCPTFYVAYMYDLDPQVVEGNDENEMNRILS